MEQMQWKENAMKGRKKKRGGARRESGMFCGLEVANLPQKEEASFAAFSPSASSFSSTSSASWEPESESLEDSLVDVYIIKCDGVSVIDDLYKNGSVDRLEIWHTYSLSDLEKRLLRNKCAEAWFYSRIIPKVEKSWIF